MTDSDQLIESHVDVDRYLDTLLGPQYEERNRGVPTGSYRRKGEGKFYKKILKYHEKKAKRYALKLAFDPDMSYIFAISHSGDHDMFTTINCVNWDNARFRIVFTKDSLDEIAAYHDELLFVMEYQSKVKPICLVTNVSGDLDNLTMFTAVYNF